VPELPDYRTLQQACWNDCWFLSALVGLACKRPQELRDMVEDVGGGAYRVTLPGRPAREVGPDDAGGGTASGPWPWGRVFEAAAAGVTDLTGPRVLTYGYGIELLTGKSRTGYTNLTGLGFAPVYRAWSRREWFREFLDRHAGDRLMVLGGTDGRFTTPAYPWIAPQHCYALLGYDRAADRVRVRDPRGVDENVPGVPLPADRKESDYGPGEFWLTAAETEDSFCGLSVEDG
jgi:hypothetical protein